MSNEPTVKSGTAKRKAALVMDIFNGKAAVAEVTQEHGLTVSESKAGLRKLSAIWKTGS